MKRTMFLMVLTLLLVTSASAYNTQVAATLTSLSGVSQLDNLDGTSITVTILNSAGDTELVSGNAGAGVYKSGATILSPSVDLSYSTAYKFRLETPQGDFTFDFTTPAAPAGGVELHTGQQTSYGTAPDDADHDGTDRVMAQWTNSGDSMVNDSNSGLIWQDGDNGVTLDWEDALTYCDGLDWGGYSSGWRLPTVVEWTNSGVDYGDADYQHTEFTATKRSYYWSSTTRPSGTGVAYLVDMGGGYIYVVDKSVGGSNYARCVRDH